MEKLFGGFILLVEEVMVLGMRGRRSGRESIMGGGEAPASLGSQRIPRIAKYVIRVLLTQGPSKSLQA